MDKQDRKHPLSENGGNVAPIVRAGMTIRSLFSAVRLEPPELRILLEHALGFSRVKLITHSEHTLTETEAEAVSDVIARRMKGEPVAYIIGIREFYGLPFAVTPDVLIPRPETELLVDLALERLPEGGKVVDLGTGSGAIAVAIAAMRPDAQVWATDISGKALDIARKNAASCLKNGQSVRFRQGNWYEALESDSRFDLIVSNPPYIHAADEHLQKGDLRFEPQGALTDCADGLSALEKLAINAPDFLKNGGWLLLEHGYDQSEAVRTSLSRYGLGSVQSWKDLAGIERVSGGKRVMR